MSLIQPSPINSGAKGLFTYSSSIFLIYKVCSKIQNVAIEMKAMSNYLVVVLFVTYKMVLTVAVEMEVGFSNQYFSV